MPFRVRFAVTGMPLTFEFPAAVNRQNRSILEGRVRTFQVSLDRADDWVTQESNSSSVSSTETFSIEAGRDWIAMMEVTEDMSSEGEGGPVMKVRNHATLTLLAGAQANLAAAQARRLIRAGSPELDATEQGRLTHIHRLRDLLHVDASLPELILDVLKTQELGDLRARQHRKYHAQCRQPRVQLAAFRSAQSCVWFGQCSVAKRLYHRPGQYAGPDIGARYRRAAG